MSTLRVTSPGLNLRLAPKVGDNVRLLLPHGTQLQPLAPRTRDGWVRVRTIPGGLEGWVAVRHTEAERATWMAVAEAEVGVREVAGERDNPRIIAYHSTTTLRATEDAVPWCSAFVNWCMRAAGYDGTRSAAARSWLSWGAPLREPRPGCVVVLQRGASPTSGHVGFYVRTEGEMIYLLGGNQGDRVCLAPYSAARVLGYRWPAERLADVA